MEQVLTEEEIDSVQELATESLDYVEPICQECWDDGEDDPLGIISGVNTRYNKRVNELVDDVITRIDDAGPEWRTDIRDDIIRVFNSYREENIESTGRLVSHSLECTYCFEEKQRGRSDSDELPIRVGDVDKDTINPSEWA